MVFLKSRDQNEHEYKIRDGKGIIPSYINERCILQSFVVLFTKSSKYFNSFSFMIFDPILNKFKKVLEITCIISLKQLPTPYFKRGEVAMKVIETTMLMTLIVGKIPSLKKRESSLTIEKVKCFLRCFRKMSHTY